MSHELDFNYSESYFDGIFLHDIVEDSLLSLAESFTETETSSIYPIFDHNVDLAMFEHPIFQIKVEAPEKKNVEQNVPEKKVGTLFTSERGKKILRYLEKKRKRTWHKKISYSCRKKVADQRVRIKGRFVTKAQASCLQNQTSSI